MIAKNHVLSTAVLLAFCSVAYADQDGQWEFRVSGNEATLTGYSGPQVENLELPSSVSCYPVTAIGSSAFNGKSWFKTARIPDSVRRIGDGAFGSCNGLVDVLIPASVTNLANNVFHSCSSITNAVILAQADVIDLGMFPSQSPITNMMLDSCGLNWKKSRASLMP